MIYLINLLKLMQFTIRKSMHMIRIVFYKSSLIKSFIYYAPSSVYPQSYIGALPGEKTFPTQIISEKSRYPRNISRSFLSITGCLNRHDCVNKNTFDSSSFPKYTKK